VTWCVENDGFAIVEKVISREECQDLIALLGPVSGAGRRNLLKKELIARLALSKSILNWVQPHLVAKARGVRGIYFDKTPEANWSVAWHQDLLIPVRQRIETAGFWPWSVKVGVTHVQPPTSVLEQMLTIRLHLDDTDEANGALRVVAGSHKRGTLSSEAIDETCAREEAAVCRVSAGGALLMRPLLVHSSRKSSGNGHRRVLHIEYAGCELPNGLEWASSKFQPPTSREVPSTNRRIRACFGTDQRQRG
jgi:hypothetical protein